MDKGSQPLVTFIIPAYNVEDYLSEAIESIRKQTVSDWKMIIAEDCSPDRTLEIAETYSRRDKRIRVVRMGRQSGGAYLPRKRAIEMADTLFVAPLDADDRVEPMYLENLLKIYDHSGADAIYPVMYDLEGECTVPLGQFDTNLIGDVVEGKEAVKYTLDGWRIHCNGGLVKRDIYLKSFAMIDEEEVRIRSYLDEYLTRLILFNSAKVAISGEKYLFRNNPTSITHSKDVRLFGYLENDHRLIGFISQHYQKDSDTYLLVHRQNFHDIFKAWRQLSTYAILSSDRKAVASLLAESEQMMDKGRLKGNVSRNYQWLLLLPSFLRRRSLQIIDWIFSIFRAKDGKKQQSR